MFTDRETIHLLQDFDVSAERAFSFFSDHERLAKIYPAAVKRIQFGEDPRDANSKGSVRRIIAFPLMIEETVTAYEPPYFQEYKITHGFGLNNHVGTMRFTDLGENKCRLEYKIEFEPVIPLSGFVIKNLLQKVIGDGVREAARKLPIDSNF
jgi:hypothetical protein